MQPQRVPGLSRAQLLTVSPRSPFLPAGPTGPGAPGAPGAPGGPAGPVSPRSPWEEEAGEYGSALVGRARLGWARGQQGCRASRGVGALLPWGQESRLVQGSLQRQGNPAEDKKGIRRPRLRMGPDGLVVGTAQVVGAEDSSPHVQIHQGVQPDQGGPRGQGDHVRRLLQKDLVCQAHPKGGEKVRLEMGWG